MVSVFVPHYHVGRIYGRKRTYEEYCSYPLPVISTLGIKTSIVDIEAVGESTLELMILNGRTLGQSQKYHESINPNQFSKMRFLKSIKHNDTLFASGVEKHWMIKISFFIDALEKKVDCVRRVPELLGCIRFFFSLDGVY